MATETTSNTPTTAPEKMSGADTFCFQILDSEHGDVERAAAWIGRNVNGIRKAEARRLILAAIARRDAAKGGA